MRPNSVAIVMLLLAVAGCTNSGLASSHTQQSVPTVTRVYDVRDLLLTDPVAQEASGGPWSAPNQPGPSDHEKASSYSKRQKQEILAAMIRAHIVPDSWEDRGKVGSISNLDGRLVINQTRQIHATIVDFLDFLRMGSVLELAVEVDFLQPTQGEDVLKQVVGKGLERLADIPTGLLLTTSQADALVAQAQVDQGRSGRFVLRLRLGERNFKTQIQEHSISLPQVENARKNLEMVFGEGFVADVEAEAVKGCETVDMTFKPTVTKLIAKGATPIYDEATKETKLRIKTGESVLLAVPFVRKQAIGAKIATGKLPRLEVVTTRAKEPPERNCAYILIQPRIVFLPVREEQAFPP